MNKRIVYFSGGALLLFAVHYLTISLFSVNFSILHLVGIHLFLFLSFGLSLWFISNDEKEHNTGNLFMLYSTVICFMSAIYLGVVAKLLKEDALFLLHFGIPFISYFLALILFALKVLSKKR